MSAAKKHRKDSANGKRECKMVRFRMALIEIYASGEKAARAMRDLVAAFTKPLLLPPEENR